MAGAFVSCCDEIVVVPLSPQFIGAMGFDEMILIFCCYRRRLPVRKGSQFRKEINQFEHLGGIFDLRQDTGEHCRSTTETTVASREPI